jgi:hypothetical protein
MKKRATKRGDWTKWRTKGFALGPFAYQTELERQLHKQMPFEDFAERIHDQMPHTNDKLPRNLIDWLYDRSLRSQLEKSTVELARKTLRTRSGQSSRGQMANLLKLLSAYPNFDPERALRKAVGSRKESRTARRAAELKQNLRDLSYQIDWWLKFSDWGS